VRSRKGLIKILFRSLSQARWPNIGVATHIGRRTQNEDRFHICEVEAGKYLYCGLFDGAGGTDAADFASKELHRIFEETNKSDSEEKRLVEAILRADQIFSSNPNSFNCGTTATVALVSEKEIIIGNVGDTRGILCQNGLAAQISQDHRPSNPSERKRLEDAGVSFTDDPFGAARLMGVLNFSRAIGLNLFKQYGLDNQASVERVQIKDEHKFLILGTDGIFDVLSRQEVIELGETMPTAQSAAESILSATAGRAKDNATVVVVGLPRSSSNFSGISAGNQQTSFSKKMDMLKLSSIFGRKNRDNPTTRPSPQRN